MKSNKIILSNNCYVLNAKYKTKYHLKYEVASFLFEGGLYAVASRGKPRIKEKACNFPFRRKSPKRYSAQTHELRAKDQKTQKN